MFLIGIYTGLRISDIRNLRVRDLRGKTHLDIRAIKTGKSVRVPINEELKFALEQYFADKYDFEYILRSREGANKSISNQQAYNILRNATEAFGLKNIGTHTMRKTFGYFLYQSTKDIVLVKEVLSQSHIEITRRYIGLVQDNKDEAVLNLSYDRVEKEKKADENKD